MTLDEQIVRTQEEYDAYSKANFANPDIIEWLKCILASLKELKNLIQ